MATENTKILTAEQEQQLRQPIDEYVGGIQAKIDALRKDGTDQVVEIQSSMDSLKRDRIYTQQEKEAKLAQYKADLEKAKAVESQNKAEVDKLIAEAESYLNSHFGEYYQAVVESGKAEKVQAQEKYQAAVAQLNKEHQETMAKLSDQQEIKDEKYVYKNRLFDAKMDLNKDLQEIKDRQHAAFDHKYHLIDMLRMSKFTFAETMAQRWENYKYTFNRRDFLLKNGLYIAIIIIFIGLCIATPILKGGTQLLTMNNILNILQQASPRMFLALGVAGLILLAGTDLSIGRMVGMGMTAATIVMHQGPNTGGVFGHIFDFSTMPVLVRVLLALVVCIVLCTVFTTIAGFFTAKFKMHPFISTRANMLVIFGLVQHPRHDHSPVQRLPHHHSVGCGRGGRGVVHLEQDHLRQEPVCRGRQPRGRVGLRYLCILGHRGRLRAGWHPVRLRLLAGVYPHGGFRLCRLRPGLGDGRHRRLRGGRYLLHRRHR